MLQTSHSKFCEKHLQSLDYLLNVHFLIHFPVLLCSQASLSSMLLDQHAWQFFSCHTGIGTGGKYWIN